MDIWLREVEAEGKEEIVNLRDMAQPKLLCHSPILLPPLCMFMI